MERAVIDVALTTVCVLHQPACAHRRLLCEPPLLLNVHLSLLESKSTVKKKKKKKAVKVACFQRGCAVRDADGRGFKSTAAAPEPSASLQPS